MDDIDYHKKTFISALMELNIPYDGQELYSTEMLSSERFYEMEPGVLKIKTFIIPFNSKLDYMFSDWKRNYTTLPTDKRKRELLNLKELIRLDDDPSDPAVIEVGWSVTYNVHPSEYSKDSRRAALMQFMSHTREHLTEGMLGVKPRPGVVLTARPVGPRLDLGFTDESLMIGQRTRSSFASRFGFGPLQSDGFQYAIYNSECKIMPIDLEKTNV